MKLALKDIESYIKFVFADLDKNEKLKKMKEWSAKSLDDIERNFIYIDEFQQIIASMNYSHFLDNIYHLKIPLKIFEQNLLPIEPINMLFSEVIKSLLEKNAKKIETRIIPHPIWEEALLKNHFKKMNTRIEFKTEINDLPHEIDSPLSWQAVNLEGPYNLSYAAKVLEQAGIGDPDWNEDEDNFGLLLTYINDPVFNSTTDCIHLGFIGSQVAAIVIAQVEKESAWSRLTYMGLIPKFRRQNLGIHVHRHGFSMMRAQGGKEYQGGTLIQNQAMIRLFEKNFCKRFRVLEEWHYHF